MQPRDLARAIYATSVPRKFAEFILLFQYFEHARVRSTPSSPSSSPTRDLLLRMSVSSDIWSLAQEHRRILDNRDGQKREFAAKGLQEAFLERAAG